VHIDQNNRLEDLRSILQQIVAIAEKYDVDKVLFLGDLFTSRRPTALEYRVAYEWVMALRGNGLSHREVVLMAGNHDEQQGATTLDAFDLLKVGGVTVVHTGHVEDDIFMGHFILNDAVVGPSKIHVDGSITVAELLEKFPGHRMYLFGDIHEPQTLHESPFVGYIGSVMRNNFGERGNQPRVFVIDGETEYMESIGLSDRPMLQFLASVEDGEVVCSTKPEVTQPGLAHIECAIIKVVLRMTEAESVNMAKYEGLIRERFKDASSLVLHYEVDRTGVVRDTNVTEDVDDASALGTYVSKRNSAAAIEDMDLVVDAGVAIINKLREKK